MKYQVNDKINGSQVFDTEAEAQAALPVAQAAFLEREGYRFSMVVVVVDGNNTTWRNAVESDADDGDYRVFNQWTGQHEPVSTKAAAQARVQELKAAFLVEAGLDKVYEYVPPPAPAPTIPTEVL